MSTDLPAGAARTPPVERRRTFQVAELSDLSAERQRRHVALDGRWPWIDPIWHEVVLARSPVGHGQAECALLSITRYCPHLRLIRVATFSPPGVTFESVDPTQLAGGLARALCRDCSLARTDAIGRVQNPEQRHTRATTDPVPFPTRRYGPRQLQSSQRADPRP